MPFVTKEHREYPDMMIPGDRCYSYYRLMVEKWKIKPSWTTADMLYAVVREHTRDIEMQCAKELAWQVFFQLHVMPYEIKKREENGEC